MNTMLERRCGEASRAAATKQMRWPSQSSKTSNGAPADGGRRAPPTILEAAWIKENSGGGESKMMVQKPRQGTARSCESKKRFPDGVRVFHYDLGEGRALES